MAREASHSAAPEPAAPVAGSDPQAVHLAPPVRARRDSDRALEDQIPEVGRGLGDEERARLQVVTGEIVQLGDQREDELDVVPGLLGRRDDVLANELGTERDVGRLVPQTTNDSHRGCGLR